MDIAIIRSFLNACQVEHPALDFWSKLRLCEIVFSAYPLPFSCQVLLPKFLQTLILPHWFNKSLDDFEWPEGLRTLRFGDLFNQPLGSLPKHLETLKFGHDFDQSVGCWPSSLQHLALGDCFNQNLHHTEARAWS